MNIIVACDRKGGYSKDGLIPWDFNMDWGWFRTHTTGAYCIMGRRTYEDILERKSKRLGIGKDLINPEEPLLAGRTSLVITRNNIPDIGVVHYPELKQALQNGCKYKKMPVFILGGYRLWIQALPEVKKIYQTVIDKDYGCDKHFPLKYLTDNFKITRGEGPKSENGVTLRWVVWDRK